MTTPTKEQIVEKCLTCIRIQSLRQHQGKCITDALNEATAPLEKEFERLQQGQRIYTRCPACNNDTLVINKGHLLCTWHECPNPIAIEQLQHRLDEAERACAEMRQFIKGVKELIEPCSLHDEWPNMQSLADKALSSTCGQDYIRKDELDKVLQNQLQSEDSLLSKLREAEKDKKRLDWIEENCTYRGGGNGGVYSFTSPLDTECFRAAIDSAMNKEKEQK